MAKYRRKGEVVEALFSGVGVNLHGRYMLSGCPSYAYVDGDGCLIVRAQESFDREYERVEDYGPSGTRGPCSHCGREVSWNEVSGSDGNGGLYCGPCWGKTDRKKPTPLTLADLRPGDVFCWGDRRYNNIDWPRCGKQVLDASSYFSVRWRRVVACGEGPRGASSLVERIAHYDITPKQQLWIDATPEERGALKDSIRDKWLPIMRGEKRGRGSLDCPLCVLAKRGVGYPVCEKCIIGRFTKKLHCQGTPWYYGAIETGEAPKDARAFTLWLAEFLPPIHPLRIEVEATPVEWPGNKEK